MADSSSDQEPKSKKTRVDAGAPFWERPATRWYAGMHDTCKVKRWEKLRNRLLADETPISPDLGPPWEPTLVNIVKDGLPQAAPNALGRKPKVVVVGAGISGLTAARELLRAGFNVEILERTQQAGGRILSLRKPFSDGLWAEAGAMRIPPVHYLVHAYAHKSILDVPMDTFQNAVNWKYLYLDEPELPKKLFMLPDPGFYDRSSCFQENPAYIEKQRKANNDVKALRDYWHNTYNVAYADMPYQETHSNNNPKTKMEKTTEDLRDEILKFGYSEVLAKYNNHSYRRFLEEKGWTETDIELFGAVSGSESLLDLGAPEVFIEDAARLWDDTSYYENPIDGEKIVGLKEFTGGMDKFTEGFLESSDFSDEGGKILDHIVYGAKVTHYETTPDCDGNVHVTYVTERGNEERVSCDFVVNAIPFLANRDIQVSPPFSPEKQTAIRDTSYGQSGKIMLEYSKQWWLEPKYAMPENGGGGLVTTKPIRAIYYPSKKHSEVAGSTAGVIIASYTWQQDSMVWGSMSDKERVQRAVDQVEEVHPGTKNFFKEGSSVMWQNEDYIGGGAFAFFKPGDYTRLYKSIIQPDGDKNDMRFVFCGEHASEIHGWIQGALSSALWAAKNISDMHGHPDRRTR